jgi:hypothetical protein
MIQLLCPASNLSMTNAVGRNANELSLSPRAYYRFELSAAFGWKTGTPACRWTILESAIATRPRISFLAIASIKGKGKQ